MQTLALFWKTPLALILAVSIQAACGTGGGREDTAGGGGGESPDEVGPGAPDGGSEEERSSRLRGDLYIATLFDGSVYRYDSRTQQLKPVVSNLGALAVGGIAVGREDCNLYVSFQGVMGAGVSVFSGTTDALLGTFVPPDPMRNGGLTAPGPTTFGPDGSLYVTSGTRLVRYARGTGQVLRVFGLPTTAIYLTFGHDGVLYMSQPTALGVRALNLQTGAINRFVDFPLGMPAGITFGSDGNFYAAQNIDYGRVTLASISRFTSSGRPERIFVQERSGGLGDASGLAFGPDGNLYVLAFSGNKVLRYRGSDGSPLGVLLSIPGPLGAPHQLAFSPCSR